MLLEGYRLAEFDENLMRGDGAYKTRLYRALGYDTFEECCEEEAEASHPRVKQVIAATEVAEILDTKVAKVPAREAHARPLTALPPPGPAPCASLAVTRPIAPQPAAQATGEFFT